MTVARSQPLSLEQFLQQCPEDGRYELVGGELGRILATRQHEDVVRSPSFSHLSRAGAVDG